ncbi:MAG: peptidylprolyl isomerase, partial [Thermodesulfovibrionales bacterium]|nr:peptidylprolyl isomerase [Thermodesulfovibrionales bacterium]
PTHLRLSQIVLKKDEDVQKVFARLQMKEDFGVVASEMSVDKASAKAKGDIGFIKKEDLKPEMQRAVMQLKKGDVSMPIKLKDNIHILKVTDIKGSQLPFDLIKGQLIQNLTMRKQREAFNQLIDNISKNYKVDINAKALAKLAEPQQPPASTTPQTNPQSQTQQQGK